MSDFYDYETWVYTKIVDVIYKYHLMDEIYDIYHTEDSTDNCIRGRLGHRHKAYRVWQTSSGEWLFKEIEYEQ